MKIGTEGGEVNSLDGEGSGSSERGTTENCQPIP